MKLAISLYGDQAQVLADRLAQLATRHRYAELRLDRIPDRVDLQILQQSRAGLQLILACVPTSEGGEFADDAAAWQIRISRALQIFGRDCYVDVPPCFADSVDLPADIPRIWSWHQNPNQNDVDLGAVHQSLTQSADAARGDVIKIVAWADTHEQALRILPLYQRSGPPLVAFAQGPGGPASRLWALAFGAPWTYACWQGAATAPGQWSEHQVRRRQNWQGIPLCGVLGDPVAHSRSPRLWRTAFALLRANRPDPKVEAGNGQTDPGTEDDKGQPGHGDLGEALYLPLQQQSLADFTTQYRHPCFRAFSVTAPLKLQALALADVVDPAAAAVGAANLLIRQGLGWRASNTDGVGALEPLVQAGLKPGQPIVIVGAGGAARAAAYESLQRGHPVTIAARRKSAAQELADRFHSLGEIRAVELTELDLLTGGPGAVIQATPLGSSHSPGDPLQHLELPGSSIFLDMVYQPAETELLRRARAAGNQVLGGQHMLLAQMIEQFDQLCGFRPPAAPLRLALEHDLGLPSVPIFLLGPRASGKSTLGRRLAELLGWNFLDADEELEKRHQRDIASWIPTDPNGFRDAEASLLKEFTTHTATVIALGGGVVERSESVELLARQPRVLGLQAELGELLARRTEGDRPALTDLNLQNESELLAKARNPLYEKACHSRWINVGGMESVAFRRLLESLNLIA
jgi:shikimate dehydrogenase